MAALKIPEQWIPLVRRDLLSSLSSEAHELSQCHTASTEAEAEEHRRTVEKINALVAGLDALGWAEGENGLGGDATLEQEPAMMTYIVAELVVDAPQASVGDRELQGYVAWLSDVQDQLGETREAVGT